MEPPADRLTAQIYGRVQGVNFRYYTRERALSLRLTGWVCNQADGSVAVLAEGPRLALAAFLEFLQRGPRLAVVDRVDTAWQPATGQFPAFEILSEPPPS